MNRVRMTTGVAAKCDQWIRLIPRLSWLWSSELKQAGIIPLKFSIRVDRLCTRRP